MNCGLFAIHFPLDWHVAAKSVHVLQVWTLQTIYFFTANVIHVTYTRYMLHVQSYPVSFLSILHFCFCKVTFLAAVIANSSRCRTFLTSIFFSSIPMGFPLHLICLLCFVHFCFLKWVCPFFLVFSHFSCATWWTKSMCFPNLKASLFTHFASLQFLVELVQALPVNYVSHIFHSC